MTIMENPFVVRCITFGKNLIMSKKYRRIAIFSIAILFILTLFHARVTTTQQISTSNDIISPFVFWVLELLIILLTIGYISQAHIALFYQYAFESIGFKNSSGKFPILLYYQKNSRFFYAEFINVGIPLDVWEKNKTKLETSLNISISEIKTGNGYNKTIIYGAYGIFDYTKKIHWSNENLTSNSQIFLGESLFNPISVDLSLYPHILIGGATGSGKTWLLKLMLLQAINKQYMIIIADFKGKVDYPKSWEHYCSFATELNEVQKYLHDVCNVLEKRKILFSNFGYSNIDIYNQHQNNQLPRIIFACDELAEILDTTRLTTTEKEPIKQIQKYISTIARLGRAFGIHLILATQRPDANILSGQIKNNISYKVCGRADQVLSQIILDSSDASIRIPSDAQGLFLNQDGTIFKAYVFDENKDILVDD